MIGRDYANRDKNLTRENWPVEEEESMTKQDLVSPFPWVRGDSSSIKDANGITIYDESSCGGGGFKLWEDEEFCLKAANAFNALMEEHKDGECYCMNTDESLGRNPCAWCKVEAIYKAKKGGGQ